MTTEALSTAIWAVTTVIWALAAVALVCWWVR